MLNEAWAIVAAALGSSALTGLVAFGLEEFRSHKTSSTTRQKELTTACEQFITAAMMSGYRWGILQRTAIIRSGFRETLDIVLHHRKPIDPIEFANFTIRDLESMLNAQAKIWLIGKEELISQSKAVLNATLEVVALSNVPPLEQGVTWKQRIINYLRSFLPATIPPDQEKLLTQATKTLGRECRIFSKIMRETLGTSDTEALLRAFPDDTLPLEE